MDDLTDDTRTSDIQAFNSDLHQELRERHPELIDSEEDLAGKTAVKGATLDPGNCWLSSAYRLDLKKSLAKIPKPSQLEVKTTNAILSEQAERDMSRRNVTNHN